MEANRITPAEVELHLDRGEPIVFIDARNEKAWQSSEMKLPGALRIPAEEAEGSAAKLPTDQVIVAYCT